MKLVTNCLMVMAMFRQAFTNNLKKLVGTRTATSMTNADSLEACPAMAPVAMSIKKMPRIPSIKAQYLLNYNPSTRGKMHKVTI